MKGKGPTYLTKRFPVNDHPWHKLMRRLKSICLGSILHLKLQFQVDRISDCENSRNFFKKKTQGRL
jgi:hypothetical protein